MILALLLCLAAPGGQGLEVDRVRGDAGEVYLRVTATQDLPEAVPRLVLDHGEVREIQARRVRGDGVLTLLALDQSGSFSAYRLLALDLAGTYGAHRRTGERVGLVLFGLSAEDLPTSTDDRDLAAALQGAAGRPAQPETRLGEFVRQAAARAHAEHPPAEGGLRQVVVFTDGGEESTTWSVDEVAAEARELDVRVHVVAFYRSSRGELASRLDNLSRLADRTGGTYVQVEDEAQAARALESLAASSSRSLEVRATVCGPSPGGAARFDNHAVYSELLDARATATTDAVVFEHVGLPPCQGAAGLPVARDGEGRPTSWACLLVAVAGLFAILALVALSIWAGVSRRDRDEATPTEEPEPEPVAKPAAKPAAKPVKVAPPSSEPPPPRPQFPEDLPETHLLCAAEGPLAGRKWRFRARVLHAGAEPDNELVADLPEVSGHHARFELYRSGDVYVEDLGSTNGTWVQGRRLTAGERVLLHPGDRVALSAQVVLELLQPGRPE